MCYTRAAAAATEEDDVKTVLSALCLQSLILQISVGGGDGGFIRNSIPVAVAHGGNFD